MKCLILDNVEILPISDTKFGALVTEEEAAELQRDGYNVKKMPGNEKVRHYIEVNIGAHQREELGFEVALLETSGRGSIVISPLAWAVGNRSGVKAYLKSVSGRINEVT
jgi:hypothetical protein